MPRRCRCHHRASRASAYPFSVPFAASEIPVESYMDRSFQFSGSSRCRPAIRTACWPTVLSCAPSTRPEHRRLNRKRRPEAVCSCGTWVISSVPLSQEAATRLPGGVKQQAPLCLSQLSTEKLYEGDWLALIPPPEMKQGPTAAKRRLFRFERKRCRHAQVKLS